MMDEKIQLPDFLIAELYKETLVDLNIYPAETKFNETAPGGNIPIEEVVNFEKIQFLGENKKKVTILVNEPGAVFLLEDDLTFLTNILKACQLNLVDIAIVNLAKQITLYERLKNELQPEKLLLFDVEPSVVKLPFLIPTFQLQKFDGCLIMVAPPLTELNKATHEGKLLKTKLWLALKQIFNI